MSLLLAQLIRTTAKTANAAAQGLHHRRLLQPSSKKGGAEKPGCTPCEAMARVQAARQMTKADG